MQKFFDMITILYVDHIILMNLTLWHKLLCDGLVSAKGGIQTVEHYCNNWKIFIPLDNMLHMQFLY